MGDVVIVGSVNVDFVVVADRLPGPGETVIGGAFARHWGGKGANQAVAAARFGAAVTFFGAVGDDDLGRASVAALDAEGIDTGSVDTATEEVTGAALIVVDRDGDNQIAVASGANLAVDGGGVETVVAAGRSGVVLTGFEVPDVAVARAVAAAVKAGWPVVVNPAPGRPLPEALRDSGAILTPNRGELAIIAGAGSPEVAARRLVDEVTGGPVVVTLGGDGALLVTREGVARLRPPAVTPRDTTGAGDAFNGVLAAALAERRPLEEAARLGVAAAAYSVEVDGAREGMLDRETLLERLGR